MGILNQFQQALNNNLNQVDVVNEGQFFNSFAALNEGQFFNSFAALMENLIDNKVSVNGLKANKEDLLDIVRAVRSGNPVQFTMELRTDTYVAELKLEW